MPQISEELASALAGFWISALMYRRCFMATFGTFFFLCRAEPSSDPAGFLCPLLRPRTPCLFCPDCHLQRCCNFFTCYLLLRCLLPSRCILYRRGGQIRDCIPLDICRQKGALHPFGASGPRSCPSNAPTVSLLDFCPGKLTHPAATPTVLLRQCRWSQHAPTRSRGFGELMLSLVLERAVRLP